MRTVSVLLKSLLPAVIVCLAAACSGSGPPDLIVITVDTLRADRLGSYGHGGGLTPAMDRLAEQGVRYGRASATVPITLPSHSSIFTGRYPNSTGVRNNGSFVLPESETTLAEILKEQGWATGAVVAAYPLHARFGLDQGFDIYDDEFPVLPGGETSARFFPEREASAVTDRALEIWERLGRTGKRRFLWVHYFDPHAPYNPPEPYRSAHGDLRYDGEVAYTDSEIGRLLQGTGGGTGGAITVLTADHGESLGEHGEKTHGLFVYQATMDVPLILNWPPGIPGGVTVETPVSLVDLVPTLLDLLEYPAPAGLDGIPASFDAGGTRSRPIYGESFLPKYNYNFSELRMIRDGSLKYIDAPTPELYDLDQDPGELRNLEGGHPDQDLLTAALAEILAAEDPEALDAAAGGLDPEAEANLRSLGYMAGGGGTAPDPGRGRDPKDMIRYIKDMDRVHGIIASGDPEAGFALFESLVEEVPENHMALLQYAGALFGERRFKEAEARLLELLDRQPEMNAAWVMLGGVRSARGDIEPAAEAYRMAGSLSGRGEPYFQMASMYREAGEFRDAADAYFEAVNREPSNQEYLEGFVEFHQSRGTLEEAETLIGGLEDRHPDAAVRSTRGDILRRLGRYEEAAVELQAALDLSPGMFKAESTLGWVELELGRLEQARDRFRILCDRRPENTPVRFGLAKALTLLGDHQAAAPLFRRILEEHPDYSPVFTFRGEILEKEGDASGAARMYQEALRLNRGDREAWEGYQRVRAR